MSYILVHTSVSSQEDAQRLADSIVEQHRLAACCWISGPIASTYWWKGKVDRAQEWVCQFKTRADLYEKLEQAIRVQHSYETPEIVVTSIVAGNADFLAWIEDETTQKNLTMGEEPKKTNRAPKD